MNRNDLLSKMAEFRIEDNLQSILQDEDSYNLVKAAIADCEDKLKELDLPKEAYKLIDKYASTHNDMASLYGNSAYKLGFADGIDIILEKSAGRKG